MGEDPQVIWAVRAQSDGPMLDRAMTVKQVVLLEQAA